MGAAQCRDPRRRHPQCLPPGKPHSVWAKLFDTEPSARALRAPLRGTPGEALLEAWGRATRPVRLARPGARGGPLEPARLSPHRARPPSESPTGRRGLRRGWVHVITATIATAGSTFNARPVHQRPGSPGPGVAGRRGRSASQTIASPGPPSITSTTAPPRTRTVSPINGIRSRNAISTAIGNARWKPSISRKAQVRTPAAIASTRLTLTYALTTSATRTPTRRARSRWGTGKPHGPPLEHAPAVEEEEEGQGEHRDRRDQVLEQTDRELAKVAGRGAQPRRQAARLLAQLLGDLVLVVEVLELLVVVRPALEVGDVGRQLLRQFLDLADDRREDVEDEEDERTDENGVDTEDRGHPWQRPVADTDPLAATPPRGRAPGRGRSRSPPIAASSGCGE